MDDWLFFSLLVIFIVVSQLPVPRRSVEDHEREVSARVVRVVHVGWYVLLAIAILGWWFRIDAVSWLLGILFVSAAFNALLVVLTWIGVVKLHTTDEDAP